MMLNQGRPRSHLRFQRWNVLAKVTNGSLSSVRVDVLLLSTVDTVFGLVEFVAAVEAEDDDSLLLRDCLYSSGSICWLVLWRRQALHFAHQ